ncbi:transglutaminase domain-containing protein [Fulvivirga maritima]|uniref:transglutaminase-like domain-containing protein n=1 Tax=Fulvivirga maritima TaxID=2904247 RepID=UPI001F2A8B29|nr:transglutaminase domain-containing protein [Fulvivirga maritima]UII25742.1 transglutaminase domain-containing protein [Fulvivirga maritima]
MLHKYSILGCTFTLFIFISSLSLGQKKIDPERVKDSDEISSNYKDASVAALMSTEKYTFSIDKKDDNIRVLNEENELFIGLKDHSEYVKRIHYNDNVELGKTSITTERGKSFDHNKFCGHYQSGEIFYSDAQICAYKLNLTRTGTVVHFSTETTYSDPKYLTYVFFHEDLPVLKKEITFEIPVGIEVELKEINFEGYDIQKKIVGNKFIYTLEDLPAQTAQEHDPGYLHYMPHILILTKSYKNSQGSRMPVLASTNDLYKWYHELTSNIDNKSSELSGKVNELIKDKTTDKEKIEAIYYWVQDNIKYIAFENGLAGFQPDPANKVFYNKYGDCKGMANLTKEMLRLVGYDARLTWIGTNKIPYTYDIPSLAVDNHMVCTVLLNGNRYILDATEKYNPMNFNAERIQGKEVLIENGDNYLRDKVAEQPLEDYLEEKNWEYTIIDGSLQGKGTTDIRGEYQKILMNYIFTADKADQDELLKVIVSGSSEPDDFKIANYNEINRNTPIHIEYNMNLADQVSSFGSELYLDLDFSDDYKNLEIEEERKIPYAFTSKRYSRTHAKVLLPAGYKVNHLPDAISIDSDYFSFNARYEEKEDGLYYFKEIKLLKTVLPTNEFGQWNASIKDLNKFYNDLIILTREN